MIYKNLLDKYVSIRDNYTNELIKEVDFINLFTIIDGIRDPYHAHEYAIRSVYVKKFEIWVRINQIVILNEDEQRFARLLYGK